MLYDLWMLLYDFVWRCLMLHDLKIIVNDVYGFVRCCLICMMLYDCVWSLIGVVWPELVLCVCLMSLYDGKDLCMWLNCFVYDCIWLCVSFKWFHVFLCDCIWCCVMFDWLYMVLYVLKWFYMMMYDLFNDVHDLKWFCMILRWCHMSL